MMTLTVTALNWITPAVETQANLRTTGEHCTLGLDQPLISCLAQMLQRKRQAGELRNNTFH